MRKPLPVLVLTCAVIFATVLVLANTVYRGGDMPAGVWLVMTLGLFLGGAGAAVGGGVLLAARRRAG